MSWGDLGCPIVVTEDVIRAVKLIRHLYWDLREPTGGPLHVVLDDQNLDDQYLGFKPERYDYLFDGRWTRWAQAGEDVSKQRATEIMETCEEIRRLLVGMDMQERHSAVAWALGDAEKYMTWAIEQVHGAAGSPGPRGATI